MNKPYTEQEIKSGKINWPDGKKYFIQDLLGYQWFTEAEPEQCHNGGARKSGFILTAGGKTSCYSSNGNKKLIIIKKEQ